MPKRDIADRKGHSPHPRNDRKPSVMLAAGIPDGIWPSPSLMFAGVPAFQLLYGPSLSERSVPMQGRTWTRCPKMPGNRNDPMRQSASESLTAIDQIQRESGGLNSTTFEANRKKFYTVPAQAKNGHFNCYYSRACKTLV